MIKDMPEMTDRELEDLRSTCVDLLERHPDVDLFSTTQVYRLIATIRRLSAELADAKKVVEYGYKAYERRSADWLEQVAANAEHAQECH